MSAANYTLSRGVKFYGEGNTQTLTFSSDYNESCEYTWLVKGIEKQGETFNNTTIAQIEVTSTPTVAESVPISLKITKPQTCLTKSTPNYYYDDTTGVKKRHSFFISTSCDDVKNTRYRENLNILTYDTLDIRLDSTFPDKIFASEGNEYYYDVYLKAALSGSELKPCYGLYGDDWRWLTFEDGLSTEDVPCTWYHMHSGGLFPKKWRHQPVTNIKIAPRSPIQHTITNIKWEIDAEYWKNYINDDTSNFISLSHLTVPIIVDGIVNSAFHFSYKNDTTFFINVSVEYSSSVYGLNKIEKRLVTSTLQKDIYIVPDVTLFVNNKYTLLSK